MNAERPDIIDIPEEFRIASTLNSFEPGKVLQFFINHVSFFCTLGGGYIRGYSQATMVTSEYSVKIHAPELKLNQYPAIAFDNKELATKCIIQIGRMALEKGKTAEKKRKKSLPVVNSLYKAIGSYSYCPEKIYLDEETVLDFTKDFRIVCELHHCYPKAYLEYFMNKISMAEDQAYRGLKIPRENPAAEFFHLLNLGFGNLRPPVIKSTEAQIDFIDAVQEFHARVFIIRSPDKRIAAYRDFYKTHYLNIIKEKHQS